jgi:hypothetical protein
MRAIAVFVFVIVLVVAMAAASGVRAQDEYCPADYPVDCGTGECCPAGNYCVAEGGCAPVGWSSCGGGSICPPGMNIFCPRLGRCYASPSDGMAEGCAFEEQTVCSVPVQ